MAAWVMFFVLSSKLGTSSVVIDFTTKQQCESGMARLSTMVPSIKEGYFHYGECFQK